MTFSAPLSSPQPLPGEPGYEHIREIARGGYGQVHLFRRIQPDGRADYVAGKFVHRHAFGPADDPASSAAYERAALGLGNFRSLSTDSPFLLRVFDVCHRHDQGYFSYMMELADDVKFGRRIDPANYRPRTLKNELERQGNRQRLPAGVCIELAIALASGLRLLHEAGFTHRDVRPSNIIFVDDVPKLADIDLLAEHDAALASYIPKQYAAPEGGHSQQADVFSLGRTLYEISTGLSVSAFPCLPPDIRFWPDHHVFLKINRIIARACAREASRRFQSAQELAEALRRI